MGNRMSSLPLAQYCAQSARLDVGAGRAAAMSTAFHALCKARADNYESAEHRRKLEALSEEEREEIATWHHPAPLEALGLKLAYKLAETEFEVALTEEGIFTSKKDAAATVGHVDMAWVITTEIDGEQCKVAIVGDIKRQRWTTPDGPASLQLHAYGYAVAQKHGCDYYLPALWLAEEGEWIVGEWVSMFGLESGAVWTRILAAALNDSEEYAHGPHCGSCYSRLNCPAHMVRYGDALVVPGTLESEVDAAQALELLTEAERYKDTAEAAKTYLKEWVKRNGPIPDGNGKVWGPIPVKGKESVLSVAKMREALGDEAERFIYRAKAHTQTRWHKA